MAGGERVPLLHYHSPAGEVLPGELGQHGERLRVAHYPGLWPTAQNPRQRRAVVRLHMVHHHIVQRASAQAVLQILLEPHGHGLLHGIQQHRLLVQHQIGVVADASGDGKDILKKGQAAVRSPYVHHIRCDLLYTIHGHFSFVPTFSGNHFTQLPSVCQGSYGKIVNSKDKIRGWPEPSSHLRCYVRDHTAYCQRPPWPGCPPPASPRWSLSGSYLSTLKGLCLLSQTIPSFHISTLAGKGRYKNRESNHLSFISP